MIRKLYAVQGKNQRLFMQRASILRELVTVTNLLKKPKNDVAYIVFLKTEEKWIVTRLLHYNCYIFP